MKYIVLSFDDSLVDFKSNALPILNKYSFKASINVITGFVDKTMPTDEYQCMTIGDIKTLDKLGFDIAVHTDSHLKPTTSSDFKKSKNKLSKWLGKEDFGTIVPFSQKMDALTYKEVVGQGYKYIADCPCRPIGRSIKATIIRIFNHCFHNPTRDRLVSFNQYFYDGSNYKNDVLVFKRIPATRQNKPELLIKLLKLMKNKTCLTIVFHSILNDLSEKCPWPEGAWTINEFEDLLSFINKRRDFIVLTQMDIVNGYKN